MKQNSRDRVANNGRQPYAAANVVSRPTIVTCQKENAEADSEEPLGPQPTYCTEKNLSESSPDGASSLSDAPEPRLAKAANSPAAGTDWPDPAANAASKPFAEGSNAPRRFKSYDLLWEHSKDALSTTYAAKNGAVDQILSLRLFNARVSDSLQIKEIQKAAQKASELTHMHLVTVYENGIDETGAPYVVSDLVEGNSLSEVLQLAKRLDIARFLHIFNQVAEALIEAHSHELFHGNLSPEKIVLTPNEIDSDMVKLVDFGMPPDPVRNAFYLSPEQCLDKSSSDTRSDIYSLGCIMYEALVGTPPFVGSNASQAALNYLHELANQFPKESPEHNALKLLDCIIIKCLQKKPSKRFRNVRELMQALSLVNDCICNGSTKKLPPKAEKLLIFRFLDLFGNKIAACMTAYLIVGFASMKVIGEVNLQKHLDQASLSQHFNNQRAIDNWKSAIKQAEWLRKPPSFMAALHRELGDSLAELSKNEETKNKNELAKKAVTEYEKAYGYFSKGHLARYDSLALLHAMARMWSSIQTDGKEEAERARVVSEVQKLWLEKKYYECANLAASFLRTDSDKRLNFYAANANTEIALTLPAAKALRYFERAAYYFSNCEGELNFECDNLAICISRLGMLPDSAETRNALTWAALEAGDLEAAEAESSRINSCYPRNVVTPDRFLMNDRIHNYLDWTKSFNANRLHDPIRKEALVPLERILSFEEAEYGKDSDVAKGTLIQLASAYRMCGEDAKAIDAYKRFLEIGHPEWPDQLIYVDLLIKVGKKAEARRYLEKEVGDIDKYDTSSPLTMRLLKAYADDKMKQQCHDLISHLSRYSEPQRAIMMGGYSYPVLNLANHPYSRNGVIYRK